MSFASRMFRHCHARIALFVADQSGAVLPMVTVTIALLIGLTTLAIDLARYSDLQTQLQKAADAFALAGAAELDGHPGVDGAGDAISRANAAIDTLMASRNASEGASPVTVSSRTYLASLPASDATSPPTDVTIDPSKARFVEVVVTPVSVNTFFPATLFGAASNTLTTTAVAAAGFNEVLCKTSPLFICNPYEGQSPGIYDPANIGKMFVLKSGPGGTSAYSPGNYGFLSVDGNGAKILKDALAASDSGACFSQNGVTTEPGNVASASDALNVRFDIYQDSAKGYNDPDHPPAQNVRKGCLPDTKGDTCGEVVTNTSLQTTDYCNNYNNDYKNNATCNDNDPTQRLPAYPLPEDSVVDAATGVGNGAWDEGQYWQTNHDTTVHPNPYACAAGTPCHTVSRYEIYKYEIENDLLGDPTDPNDKNTSPGSRATKWSTKSPCAANKKNPETGEVGAPQCNKNPRPCDVTDPTCDRRIIYVAVIDCTTVGLKGGKNTGVYAKAFAKFFLVHPVGSDQTIYGEFQGVVEPGSDDGVLHDIVQLYR